MSDQKPQRRWLDLILLFAVVYLGSQLMLRLFFPKQFGTPVPEGVAILRAVDPTVKSGHHPVLSLRNSTKQSITVPDRCPKPPVDIFFSEQSIPDTSGASVAPTDIAIPCVATPPIAADSEVQIDLGSWKYSAFERTGIYTVRMTLPPSPALATGAVLTTSFEIYEAGWPTQVFRAFVSKPLLNLLVFIASHSPDYSLGIAIILVTIIVKLILFIPTQHGLQGQKKMQALQPKIEELRKRHEGDAKKLNEETMKLWKEHKINPFQSCLPLLIQFPILIGLFYAVRDGSHLALSQHLLYAPYQNLAWTFGTHFLGLDLLQPDMYVLPPLLVIMQFLQMKLSFAMANKKSKERKEITKEKKPLSQQDLQQKMMLYGLPLMIGFFAFSFPAAVSLYWGASTLFAIVQQVVVNRKV